MRCLLLLLAALGAALGVAGCAASVLAAPREGDDDALYRVPKGLLIGAGTSAYQTEGAWNQDDKGINVFDYYYHTNNYARNKTGDVAADHYNRFEEDFTLAKELGLNVFRLSISWSRIFPNGDFVKPNQKGIDHYHAVFDDLKRKEIEPIVTMFHFDFPQAYQDKYNGWLGTDMVDNFEKYADFLFSEYGKKIKYWMTINEAAMYCNLAGDGGRLSLLPPFTMVGEANRQLCLHNLILAHGRAYRVYKAKYYDQYKGQIGFGIGPYFSKPASEEAADKEAADSANLNGTGIGVSLNPLIVGDYPEQALDKTRPRFTEEEKAMLKGAIDFAGVNIYSGRISKADQSDEQQPSDQQPPPSNHGGVNVDSAWVMSLLPKWVQDRYGKNVAIFFSENGVQGADIDDYYTRGAYISAFLREMVAGINRDGNNVIGYTLWSYLDSFEFVGYDNPWGLVHVDYTSDKLTRTPKRSSELFKAIKSTGYVPYIPLGEPSAAASLRPTLALAATLAALAARWLR